MSKSSELFNKALEQMKKHNAKLNANEVIQQAINFGIERETPKLKADEKLSVKVNLVPDIGFKVDILRVKKTN